MTQTVLLGDACSYVTEKISVNDVELADYVSTENLIAYKGGLSLASNLPQIGKVTRFQTGDVLVSNIRPYFKKIWHADREGGASNDVLVFRPSNDNLVYKYLYYVLKNDKFFDFSAASSGGSKMPRGDKAQIMKYPVYLPNLETQKKIADILGAIDEKIELNRQMNETLEQMGQALFRHYFIDNPEAEKWEKVQLGDYLKVVRGLSYKGSFLSDDDSDNPMINLGSFAVDGTYNGGNIKYYNGEYKERATVLSGDLILANTDMTQERVVLGSVLRVPDLSGTILFTHHVYGLRELQLPKEYLYYLLKRPQFRERAQGFATGTTVLFMPAEAITKLSFKLPGTKTMNDFVHVATDISDIKELVRTQIQTLTTLRDTLLPRLIDGKVKV